MRENGELGESGRPGGGEAINVEIRESGRATGVTYYVEIRKTGTGEGGAENLELRKSGRKGKPSM
jgi:hypothetical protein